MAGSLNKVLLIGRLGADPEIKQMVNGKSVARMSLATSNTWKDKNTGEKKEKTEWHRIVIFNEGLVNVVKQYVKKGSQVYIYFLLNYFLIFPLKLKRNFIIQIIGWYILSTWQRTFSASVFLKIFYLTIFAAKYFK